MSAEADRLPTHGGEPSSPSAPPLALKPPVDPAALVHKQLLEGPFWQKIPAYAGVSVLIGGNNFGCGSSREHAVWGLQQAGIRAVVAPGFGEIFYSNAMGNGLLLVTLPEAEVRRLMDEADAVPGNTVAIDVETLTLRSAGGVEARFEMLPRHQRMLLDGLDAIGLSMTYRDRIEAFAAAHWAAQPWLKDVARAGSGKR